MGIQLQCTAGHTFDRAEDAPVGPISCPVCGQEVPVPGSTRGGPPPLPCRPVAPATAQSAANGSAPQGEDRGIRENSVKPDTEPTATILPNAAKPAFSGTRTSGYRAPGSWRRKTVWLATGMLLVALFQSLPLAAIHDWREAPPWAQAILLLAALEIAYAAWMLLVPDWSTVWVAMLVLTGVCMLYGTALGIAWVGPRGWPLPLGIDQVRGNCQPWCAAVIGVTFLLTYACGRVSRRWKKAVTAH